VLEKVLPKFHGTQQELEEPLKALCGQLTPSEDGAEPRLPKTVAKIKRMLKRLETQGFTSFME